MAEGLHMDWSSSNTTEAFSIFKQQCELMFDVKDIKKEKQVSHILLLSGQEGLRRFNSWGLEQPDAADPDKVWKKFEDQLEPPDNFRIARLWLQKYRQNPTESVAEFGDRCKLQAQKCQFRNDNETNDRIIDQLIYGVRHPELQKDYLSQDNKFTLKEAVATGKTYEASLSHMQKLSAVQVDRSTASLGAVNTVPRSGPQSNTCRNCGRHHPPQREKCPAYGETCGSCGKQNHWSRCCMSKNRHKSPGRNQRGRSKSRQRKQQQDRKWGPRQETQNRGATGSRFHSVDVENSPHGADGSDVASQFEQLSFSGICQDGPSNTTPRGSHGSEVFTTLDIKVPAREKVNATLKVKVDTGAQGNTLPLRIFRQMCPGMLDVEGFPKPETLKQPKVQLTAYNNTTIRHYGTISMKCSYHSIHTDAEFFIVDCDGPAIFGLLSSLALKLVSVHCAITASTDNTRSIQSIKDLLQLYPTQFDRIGQFPGEYHISTDPNIPPVVHAQRKTPIQIKDEIRQQLDEMETDGVIRPVTEPTEWVSSLSYSRKANGKLRICLDPKDLNRAILRCHHRSQTLEEVTHRLSKARVFSTLDAKNGYWSVTLDAASQLLTTFHTPYGRYCFCRLPFGLVMSQDVFQQRMDFIIEQVGDGVVCIADDVAVFAENDREHDRILLKLMETAKKHGLVFNSSKCQIKVPSIKFFGMYFDKDGAHPDHSKVEDLHNMDPPKDKTALQEFLGLATYMSPFIPNLADLTSTLRGLLKKNVVFEWTPSHQASYDNVKAVICKEVTLAYFDPTKETVVQVDASMKGLGAALLQDGKPVMFASKSLSDVEQRYANIERELLAVVFGVERFHTFLYGTHFVVESDHKPLEMIALKNLTAAPPRLQRMLLRLQGYDLQIKYLPGSQMLLADCLSRQPSTTSTTIDLDLKVCLVQFSTDKLSQLRSETSDDHTLCQLKDYVITGFPDERKKLPTALRPYWAFRDELSIENGILMKGDRVVIPTCMQQEILDKIHVGHQGATKCQLRAKSCVYWLNINKDIEQLVAACSACQKYQKTQTAQPLQNHEVPTRPWQVLGTDLFHFEGSEYLLVADYYTKFPIVRRIHGQATAGVVIMLTQGIFSEYGCPERIISDNGPQYGSQEYKRFTEEWQIDHVTSSPRYPKSNGFAERTIQTIKNILYKANKSGSNQAMALLCARTTPVDSHLPSPAEMMFNRKVVSNLPIRPTVIDHRAYDPDKVHERLEERQESQKYYHDRHGVKDLPALSPGEKITFQDQTSGLWAPAEVVDKCQEQRSYTIQTPNGSILRRNRQHIRSLPKRVHFKDSPAGQEVADESLTDQVIDRPQPRPEQSQEQVDGPYRTRCGRSVFKPQRFEQ